MIWTILTALIRKEIYCSLTSSGLFAEEQKGCRKGSRGTAELLDIDQYILNKSKNRRKNLTMTWIDYKKAYDMVSQSWIINCLKMYAIWSYKLNRENYEILNSGIESRWKKFGRSKDAKSIFQGDALSPLLLIIALLPLKHILRKRTAGYKLIRSQEKISHLMYMDYIKLFA